MAFCTRCGGPLACGVRFCPGCGTAAALGPPSLAARFLGALARFRAAVERLIKSIPGYGPVERAARILTAPVRGLATLTLKICPPLRKLEPILEIESLTKRNPILLAIPLVSLFLMGLQSTRLGHIGTAPGLYPVMAAIGVFNPFLGIVCAICFGVGDLLQKILIDNDIYGARTRGDMNFWGAIAGYCVAYSAVALSAVSPGVTSRLLRLPLNLAIGWVVKRAALRKAQGGAAEGGTIGALLNLGVTMAGAYVGSRLAMWAAPTLEEPAFKWRPDPDVSCHKLEAETIIPEQAHVAGVTGGVVGPCITGLVGPGTPPVVPVPPPPEEPPPPEYDDEGYDQNGFDRNGFDRDGYDRNGFNRQGIDRDGYDRSGFDADGFNREGYDREGFDRGGYGRDGYDRDGRDSEGFDREGFDRNGVDREGFGRDGYNADGFDRDGFGRDGFNKDGFDRDGFGRDGFDKDGLDREGFNREGFNKDGFDRDGFNSDGVDKEGFGRDGFNKDGVDRYGIGRDGFNKDGFDKDGFDRDGFSKGGFDRDGFDKNGVNADGFDRTGFDKNGLDRDGYNRDGFDRRGFNRDGINGEGKTKAEVLEAMGKRQRELEKESSKGVTMTEIAKNFGKNVKDDVSTLPGYVKETGKGLVQGTKDAAKAVYKEVTDPDNYRALAEAGKQTVKDLVTKPFDSAGKVGKFYGDVGDKAAQIGKAIAKDPAAFAKSLLGIDNWEKVIDPNVPLGERIGRALYGTLDAGLNLVGGGAAAKGLSAADKALDAAKAAKAADAAADAGKVIKAADKASDLTAAGKVVRRTDEAGDAVKAADKAADFRARKEAFQEGRKIGKSKVDEFENAVKSGDPERMKKAALDVQGDKQALWEINRRGDGAKTAMNDEMGRIYSKTDDGVRRDIAQKYGIPEDQVQIVKPTNPSAKVKVGADRDVTARVPVKDPITGETVMKDVPSRELQKIYDRNFYDAADGAKHFPDASPQQLTKKMDQLATDRMHAEAYGRGPKDLDVALNKPGEAFSDSQQISKAMAYKGHERFHEADKLMKEGKIVEAQTEMAEGMRQVSKQYRNQVMKRFDALKDQGVAVKMDTKLKKSVDILEQVESGRISPATAEKLLQRMGTTPGQVATDVGDYVHMMQALRPK